MNLHNLFTLQGEWPEINPALAQTKIFSTIINRDRKVLKPVAKLELAYIYFTVSRKHYNDGRYKDRDKKIRDRVGLPPEWKPDDLVNSAIATLKSDTLSIAERTYRSTLDTLLVTLETMDSLKEANEEMVKKIKEQLSNKKLDKDAIDTYEETAKKLREDVLFAIKVSKEIPGSVKTIEDLLKQVESEESGARMMKGKQSSQWEDE